MLVSPEQKEPSENGNEYMIETANLTVLKPVYILYFGHFSLFRQYISHRQ